MIVLFPGGLLQIYRVMGSGCVVLILGDLGEVSEGGKMSKRARKKFGRRKVKNARKSPKVFSLPDTFFGLVTQSSWGGSLRDEPKECLCRSI